MNPTEIEIFICWAREALKPGGKLYILTISPYVPTFKEHILSDYLVRQSCHNRYPGYIPDILSYCNKQNNPDLKNAPLYPLTFFCRKELEHLFLYHGFTIEQSYTITLPHTENGTWRIVDEEDGGLTALIVAKPSQ